MGFLSRESALVAFPSARLGIADLKPWLDFVVAVSAFLAVYSDI
jgi:hypothetical protein